MTNIAVSPMDRSIAKYSRSEANLWKNFTNRLLADIRGLAPYISATCVRVGDACFTLAGGSAVYESSPLQRRLRDLHAAAQHAAIHQRHYGAAGKSALAQFRRRLEEPSQLAAE